MITYSKFRPTGLDPAGLGCPDRQDWLVAPCAHNRDSDCLTESNWYSQLASFEATINVPPSGGLISEREDFEIHRFGHWGNGWFEIVLIRPDTAVAKCAEEIESVLKDYPVLDDSDFSEREQEAANNAWQYGFSNYGRIKYIREHRSQFEFRDMADLMGCVRGKYFAGYASELLS